MPERNPYLIIGVDFGARGDEARRAFAHAARRIRRTGGAWDIEDLNWALHEIEALESNPADLVSLYRVPADKTVFEPAGEGLFRPPPVPLERRTEQRDESVIADTQLAAIRELDAVLLRALGAVARPPAAVYTVAEGDR